MAERDGTVLIRRPFVEEGWEARAACRNLANPDDFFPERAQILAKADEIARNFCDDCPVRSSCLATILAIEGSCGEWNRHGIWAGTTPAQRAQAACGGPR